MKALDLTPFEFKLKKEKKSPNPTIFNLRALSGMELLELLDAQELGRQALFFTALKYGLIGWSNLQGKDGPIDFNGDMSKNVAVLDVGEITELFNEITKKSKNTAAEIKN